MREPEIRKLIVLKEAVVSEGGTNAARPICRVAGIGVFANPCSGRFVDDLSELFGLAPEANESAAEKSMKSVANARHELDAMFGIESDPDAASTVVDSEGRER